MLIPEAEKQKQILNTVFKILSPILLILLGLIQNLEMGERWNYKFWRGNTQLNETAYQSAICS